MDFSKIFKLDYRILLIGGFVCEVLIGTSSFAGGHGRPRRNNSPMCEYLAGFILKVATGEPLNPMAGREVAGPNEKSSLLPSVAVLGAGGAIVVTTAWFLSEKYNALNSILPPHVPPEGYSRSYLFRKSDEGQGGLQKNAVAGLLYVSPENLSCGGKCFEKRIHVMDLKGDWRLGFSIVTRQVTENRDSWIAPVVFKKERVLYLYDSNVGPATPGNHMTLETHVVGQAMISIDSTIDLNFLEPSQKTEILNVKFFRDPNNRNEFQWDSNQLEGPFKTEIEFLAQTLAYYLSLTY